MSLKPEISEEKFTEKVTELAKHLIKQVCVEDTTVEYKPYAAHEYMMYTTTDLVKEYPIAVEEYCSGNFGPDAGDILSKTQPEAIKDIRRRLFINTLDQKITELLNSDWNPTEE